MALLSLQWMPHFLPMATLIVVAAFTPGPNNIMLAASGANFGFRRTIPHMVGITVGFFLLLWLTGLGLDWVFGLSPLVRQVFKVLALVFILWLAWRIATSTRGSKARGESRPQYFVEAAGFQFVNPKALTMVTTTVSLFISPDFAFAPQMATMLAAAAVITVAAVATWTAFGVVISGFLDTPRRLRVFNVTMALLLVASMLPVFGEMVG